MKTTPKIMVLSFILLHQVSCSDGSKNNKETLSINMKRQSWITEDPNKWPQITMINHINYIDRDYSIAGCGFLLDIGTDTIAVTAKHILTYYKSDMMSTVSFINSLIEWEMYPKNNNDDKVCIEKIINENPNESLQGIPVDKDWLLLTVKQKSLNIQPLQFRKSPLTIGEEVYIIGWRYSDSNCTQRVYEGNLVKTLGGSLLISTKLLSNNTIPGLSGSPVIDSEGYLVGIMSQKYGKMERLSSTGYPIELLGNMSNIIK
ncbi:MAG: serine protease [Bacteroidota bacterium]